MVKAFENFGGNCKIVFEHVDNGHITIVTDINKAIEIFNKKRIVLDVNVLEWGIIEIFYK